MPRTPTDDFGCETSGLVGGCLTFGLRGCTKLCGFVSVRLPRVGVAPANIESFSILRRNMLKAGETNLTDTPGEPPSRLCIKFWIKSSIHLVVNLHSNCVFGRAGMNYY